LPPTLDYVTEDDWDKKLIYDLVILLKFKNSEFCFDIKFRLRPSGIRRVDFRYLEARVAYPVSH